MSWGPEDGGVRFYDASGGVLFQANGVGGAAAVSRGSLTQLTYLFDSIRDMDDTQNGRHAGAETRLDGHDTAIAQNGTRLDAMSSKNADQDSTLGSHGTRLTNVESKNSSQDTTLSSHNTRINAAQARADDAHADAATAQARADAAYSRASTALSDAATAQAKADQNQVNISKLVQWVQDATAQDPNLPPWPA